MKNGTLTAVLLMVVGLVTNINGTQAAPTNTTANTAAAIDALKGEIGALRKQIEELTKARAADQQTFSDSVRRQEDAAKKLTSSAHKQDLRIETTARQSVKEGIELGQTLLANSLMVTLTAATIFVAILGGLIGFIVSELGERRLKRSENKTTSKVEDVEEKVMGTDRFTRSLESLRPGAPRSELHENRSELESYLRSHPTDRRAAIILARICRADNDLGQAIAVLDRFLKAKEVLKESDKDYADALYNRACYKVRLWERNRQEVKYKDQAYEDLKRSMELSPPNKVDAESDEDFIPLRGEDRFRALVATVEE